VTTNKSISNTEQAMQPLSLFALNSAIKEALNALFPMPLWIIAEISEASSSRGHLYYNFIEKSDDQIIATGRGTLWAARQKKVIEAFKQATGDYPKPGMKILFQATVTYHERWGLALDIQTIDPSFTLGEMERKRREIVERLQKEGLFEKNKEFSFPLVVQKIAVISSSTAAGYGDFIKHLENNEYGYKFYPDLYEAIMQGNNTVPSVLKALLSIQKSKKQYDLVLICRGGGERTALASFDNYELGKAIALFKLPIITAIGHDRDSTVADLTAHTICKTPTAAAHLIISIAREFEDRINSAIQKAISLSKNILTINQNNLKFILHSIQNKTITTITKNRGNLKHIHQQIQHSTSTCFTDRKNRTTNAVSMIILLARALIKNNTASLDKHLQAIKHLHPMNTLKRGYSITYVNDRAVRSASAIANGETLTTQLYDGQIKSIAKKETHATGTLF